MSDANFESDEKLKAREKFWEATQNLTLVKLFEGAAQI